MEIEQEQHETPEADHGVVHNAEYDWADHQVDYSHLRSLAREAHLID